MKRAFLVAVLAAMALFVFATSVSAQNQNLRPDDRYRGYPSRLIRWPASAPDLEACRKQDFYEPTDFDLMKYVGRVKVAKIEAQETSRCVYTLTRGNTWLWVLRPKGTLVAYDTNGRELFDMGSPGHRPCGNPRNFSFPIPEAPVTRKEPPKATSIPTPTPAPAPPPAAILAPVPTVIPAPIPAPAPIPTPTPIPTPLPAPEPEIEVNRFGVTASSQIGKFYSSPLSGLVSRLAYRDICVVDGREFDAGLAWGRPGGSFWRFTVSGKLIEDGSFTQYFCPRCNMLVQNRSKGMRIWGGKIERVQRIGFEEYYVRPMFTGHLGVGAVTGSSLRTTRISDGTLIIAEVGARELFGSGAFPIAGLGAGLIGDLNSRLTIGVTVIGVEYPGVYWGGVSLTYWPP